MQADFGGAGTVLERLDARTLLEFWGVTGGTRGLWVFGRTGTRCNGWSLLSLKTKLLHLCYTKRYKLNRLTRDTFLLFKIIKLWCFISIWLSQHYPFSHIFISLVSIFLYAWPGSSELRSLEATLPPTLMSSFSTRPFQSQGLQVRLLEDGLKSQKLRQIIFLIT